jgi:hypothetical protein
MTRHAIVAWLGCMGMALIAFSLGNVVELNVWAAAAIVIGAIGRTT